MLRAYASSLSSAVLLSGCFSTVAVREPQGEPLPITKGHFPHEAFNGVVQKYVNDHGKIDYKALKADRNDLERYLVALGKTSPHQEPDAFPTEQDKLAYWINGYNAYVMYAVTERPQMKSVNDDPKNFFYFTEYKFGNENWSLYKLENEVVRKEFKEPRVHFALNCASGGCPELPNEAFMPDKVEEQLAREATRFCANDKKVRIKDPNTVDVSQIFEWYGDDFKASGGPIAFCKKWGRADLPDNATVQFIPYDWALNAQPGKALFEP
jgi:uncharacterized protein DUF547